MKTKTKLLLVVALLSTLNSQLSAFAQGTAFSYQGRLNDGGGPATGIYDLRLTIYDLGSAGSVVAGPLTNSATGVSNGLFTVTLDFGNTPFISGAPRWLSIEVRTNGGGSFTTLSPRQPLTATPYAITASNLTGALPTAQLTGVVPLAQLPGAVVTNTQGGVVLSGTFGGNGAGLTSLNLALNSGGAIKLGSGSFGAGSPYTVGSQPFTVVTSDVNGDGKLDIVTANNGAGTLSILTNTGSGGFSLSSSPAAGAGAYGLTAADVNADNKVDLICANYTAGTLSVLTNNGSGQFSLASSPLVGSGPVTVVAVDVNGDGKPDLITANYGGGSGTTLTILTNNGSGSFALASSPVVGSGPVNLVAADVNGDGKMDLITANFGTGGSGNTLTILTNNGTGGFALFSSPTVGSGPYGLAAADVNGDNKMDLISANYNAATASVLTNDGTGHFSLASSAVIGSGATAIAAADVNSDGKLDLITANYAGNSGNTLTVLTNNGSGGFALASSPLVGTGPLSVVATDLNGDSRADLVCANSASGTVTVILNTSSGTTFTGVFSGNGAALTNIGTASLVAGSISNLLLASGAVNAGNIATGQVVKSLDGLADTVSIVAGANVTIATNVGTRTLTVATAGGGWNTNGNAGTVAGPSFLGTTDNQPLELKVNGARAVRLEPNVASGAPNIIAGASLNFVASGTVGAAIAGGGATNYGGLRYSNSVQGDFSFIGGGIGNLIQSASSYDCAIAGGALNTIEGSQYSIIGGGQSNTNRANYATIAGGLRNLANGYSSFIGGGGFDGLSFGGNTVSGNASSIVGGILNNVQTGAFDSVIAGGYFNLIATNASVSVIAGGDQNAILQGANHSTIGGGVLNYVSGIGSFIGGGGYDGNMYAGNTNAGSASVIGGGIGNTIQTGADYSTIGAGNQNQIQPNAFKSTIGGGYGNAIQTNSFFSAIAGGATNTIQANSSQSTIGGGDGNTIQPGAANSTIAGGVVNSIRTNAYQSTIGGGLLNQIQPLANDSVIGGGYANTNAGPFATIPGGDQNLAAANAFAAGHRAKANNTGAFVWADSTDADFASTANNQFLIRASGGVGIGTTSPAWPLDVWGSQSVGRWVSTAGAPSVIELKNNAASPAYLGGINFNDSADTFPGQILYSGSDAMTFGTAHATRMTLTASGLPVNGTVVGSSAGIGTATPANQLSVAGNADFSGSVGIGTTTPSPTFQLDAWGAQANVRLVSTGQGSPSVIELKNNTVPANFLGAINFNGPGNDYPGQIAYAVVDGMMFRAGGTERMRIGMDGLVGINTTAPAYSLDVNGDLRVTLDGHYANNVYCDGFYWCKFSGNYYALDKGGPGGNGPAEWVQSSDARLKQEINTIPNAVEAVLKLRGVTWHWNEVGLQHLTRGIENRCKSASGKPEDDKRLWDRERKEARERLSKQQTGFVAQEVEKVFPDWVTSDEKGYKQINMEHLNAVLVNAIKEQQDQIETQREEIAALKATASHVSDVWEKRFAALQKAVARLAGKSENTLAANRKNPMEQ